MAYSHLSRPRRNTNDSTDADLGLSPGSDSGDHHCASRNGEFHDARRSYKSPSVQDDYDDEERPARMPSPPMSETSNAPSTDQQTVISAEFIAHLKEQIKTEIKQEVVEHFTQAGNIESITEPSKAESIQGSQSNDDQPISEPTGRVESIDGSSSTPSPPRSERGVGTSPSPNLGSRRATVISDSPPPSPLRSPPGSPTAEKLGVRFRNSVGASVDKDGSRNGRQAAYSSTGPNRELSVIDQKWGELFNNDLNPTPRLGQFLRGLANHIIEDFRPRKSIVVTPDKMAAFYENHVVENEVYPLTAIFRSSNHESLSNLYQELDCQHFLVQEESFTKPIIPALTPEGFARWMTTWIQAYPDQEARRLEKIVQSMPINADGEPVDGKPERLPKQISRHLFPKREHSESKKNVCDAISIFLDDLEASRARKPCITSPQTTRRTSSAMQPNTRPIDIPQMISSTRGTDNQVSYSRSPSDAGFAKEPANIERDRQPYTAKPGNGKVYTDALSPPAGTRPGRANSTGRGPRDSEPEPEYHPRQTRTYSNAGLNRPGEIRRAPSPPFQSFSRSNPSNLENSGGYLPAKYSSPPKQSLLSPAASYTSTKYVPSTSDIRDRDRDKQGDSRRSERRNTNEQPRSRRNTIDPTRLPPEITTPRNAERWDHFLDNRDKSRSRDRRSGPKSAGPVLHQEFPPDPRMTASDWPDAEGYLRAPPRGGEYEIGKGGKYYERR